MGIVVRAQPEAIDIVGEVTLHIETAGPVARYRRVEHQQREAHQASGGGRDLAANAGQQKDAHGGQVTNGDTLQHAQ